MEEVRPVNPVEKLRWSLPHAVPISPQSPNCQNVLSINSAVFIFIKYLILIDLYQYIRRHFVSGWRSRIFYIWPLFLIKIKNIFISDMCQFIWRHCVTIDTRRQFLFRVYFLQSNTVAHATDVGTDKSGVSHEDWVDYGIVDSRFLLMQCKQYGRQRSFRWQQLFLNQGH